MDRTVTSKRISDLLLQIHEPPPSADFFEHVLSVLDACVGSEFSAYSFTNLETRTFQPQAMHRLGGGTRKLPGLKEMAARSQAHPFREVYYERGLGPVLCTTDIMSKAEWTQTELYNEVWRPAGLLHDTSIRFYEGAMCYSFFFSSPVPLSKDCRRSLELTAPHLKQAYQAFRAQQKTTLDHFPGNMALLSAEGKAVECPPPTASLLDYYYPHEKKVSTRGFPDEVKGWIQEQIQTFSSLAGTSWGNKLIARRGQSILSMSLLKSDGGFMLLFEESVAIRLFDVLIKRGLTHREAEVMLWVCNGKQNSEIAMILQISTATVRKHLEHVFQKLSCETRGEAVQLVTQKVTEHLQGSEAEECASCTQPICTFCIN